MKDYKFNNIGSLPQPDSPCSADKININNKKKKLLKMGLAATMLFIMLFFGTLSWFTMNTQVESESLSLQAGGMPYTVEFHGTDEGKYIAQYNNLSEKAGIWLVDDDKNMDNGSGTDEEELGLEPGDSGTLEFRVVPSGDANSVTVDICFTVRGIEKPESNSGSSSNQLNQITDQELIKFIASHIMLFSGIDNNGKYTGIIQNNAQLQRYMRNKTYNKTDTGYTTLYWVWPLHLSDIISNQSDDLIYASSERSTVIQYIVANKTGFFKGITTADDVLAADLTAMNRYGSYSILFDKADLDIGNNVQYVILGLSVE